MLVNAHAQRMTKDRMYLDVLSDRVEGLGLVAFELGVRTTRNFNESVDNALLLVSPERQIVHQRDWNSV